MSNHNPKAKLPASFRTPSARPVSAMAKTTLALGISSAMMMPVTALAADEVLKLDTLSVEDRTLDTNPYAEPGAPYKAKYSADERHKRPLAEVPQNISVLTKAQIEDSGYTDLREILDAQPGITLGTGENGNAFGDRYIIRGQEARSDVFVDGLRDPGMTIRESFATEQIEISKGPSSSFAGRGTAGGAINSITKQANPEYDFTRLSTAVGTDKHTRVTVDTNQTFSPTLAVRANVLYGYEQVPDRAPADRERKGLALSGNWQATDKLNVVVDYYGLEAEDNPDLGGFLTGTVPDRKPAKDVPVYVQEEDFLKSDVDIVTARLNYDLAKGLRLTNATRAGSANNGYVVTGARGTTTDASDPNGAYDTISLSTHNGWQEVDYLVNQTNLHIDKTIAGKKHEFIVGLELSDHKVKNGVYDIDNAGETNCVVSGRGGASAGYCAQNSDGSTVNGLNSLMDRQISKDRWDQDWQAKTASVYVMDTVDLTDKWTVFGGLRYDYTTLDLALQNNSLEVTEYDYSDGMWNYHLGVTYKFLPYANVYASYATASDINGGESDVGSNSGYGGMVVYNGSVAGAEPEVTENIELGTKWNLMGGKLLATAAIFNITKSDVMEGANYDAVGTFNTGKNRVQGIELGLSGNVTDKLSAQAGVAFMKAKVLKSATPDNEGKTLSNFADTTAFAQLKYQLTGKLALGTAVKYESKKYAGQPDTAAGFSTTTGEYSQPIPSYTVVDLFATYRFNKHLDARLNIGNVADKDYYLAGYRSGSFLYKGDARNVRVTLNYDF
ncbi:MAG: TonB-dependent receptor [Pseudomonadota bacterium]